MRLAGLDGDAVGLPGLRPLLIQSADVGLAGVAPPELPSRATGFRSIYVHGPGMIVTHGVYAMAVLPPRWASSGASSGDAVAHASCAPAIGPRSLRGTVTGAAVGPRPMLGRKRTGVGSTPELELILLFRYMGGTWECAQGLRDTQRARPADQRGAGVCWRLW